MATPVTGRVAERSDLVVLAFTAALAGGLLGPLLLSTGYWLVGDMVFVPDQPWKDAWLGLDGSLPRAVPMDAVVAGLSAFLPGWVVQRLLLLAALLVGGLATGRLLSAHGTLARCAAVALVLWNPWLLERLLMGQWAIAAGGLLLPAVVLAAARARDDLRAGWPGLALALAASAVCSPSSGLVAAATALVVGWAAPRRVLGTAALALVANLPWLLPALVAARSRVTTEGVFDLFAARAESPAGLAASLLSLGGTWKSSVVPSARTSAVLVLLACVLSVVALVGLRRARPVGGRPTVRRLALVGGGAYAVALLPALPGGAALLEGLGEVLPATALLRDSHRYLAPLVVLLAVGLAGAVTWLRAAATPGRESSAWAAGLLVAAPVLLLPQQAWGAVGELQPVHYPDDWAAVVAAVEERGAPRTVVLPWTGSYRGFDFNDRRAVLDPAPRLLPGEVVVDDRTYVEGDVVPSEDPRVRAVDAALRAGDERRSPRAAGEDVRAALLGQGVRLVLVETPERLGAADEATVAALRLAGAGVAATGEELLLLDLLPAGSDGATREPSRASSAATAVVAAGHTSTLATVVVAAATLVRRRRRSPGRS